MTFDWVIAPPKYGCVVVDWTLGFNIKCFKFYFGHKVALFVVFETYFLTVNISLQSEFAF